MWRAEASQLSFDTTEQHHGCPLCARPPSADSYSVHSLIMWLKFLMVEEKSQFGYANGFCLSLLQQIISSVINVPNLRYYLKTATSYATDD
mmetsp:Transcript_16336/g.24180  ORF Transcript_16336/g.24180 Transcript_16336/m.24180 type:complete len:91 (-) Transcript_16336:574-846(-)